MNLKLKILFILSGIMSTSAVLAAEVFPCPIPDLNLKLIKNQNIKWSTNHPSPVEINTHYQRRSLAWDQFVQNFISITRTETDPKARENFKKQILSCQLTDENQEEFQGLLASRLLSLGLSEIRKLGSDGQALHASLTRESAMPFFWFSTSFTKQFDDSKELGSRANYDRSLHAAELDMDQMFGDEWLASFVHEAAHATDPYLSKAMDDFSKPLVIQQVLSLSKMNINAVTKNDLYLVDRWLMAGLHGGLLAETYAWTVTLLIYLQGQQLQQMGKVDRIQNFFSELLTKENLLLSKPEFARRVLIRLSPYFSNPWQDSGRQDEISLVFRSPWIRERLLYLRQLLMDGKISLMPYFRTEPKS